VSIVFISFLFVFSSTFWKTDRIEAVPGWDTNVREDTYVVLLGLGASEKERRDYLVKNTDHKLPVVELYIEPASLTVDQEWLPKIFVVFWANGTVVWGATKEDVSAAKEKANNQEIRYFMSRIDSDKVKELLCALSDSSVWNSNLSVWISGRLTHLTIRSEEKTYTTAVNDVVGATLYQALMEDGISGITSAMEWRRVTDKIFNMIPSESRPVSISYERYNRDDSLSWIGIIEIPEESPDKK